MINRRRFLIISLRGVVAGPCFAEAQETGKTYRIGYLSTGGGSYARFVQQGLRNLGWLEGQNLRSEAVHSDGNVERLRTLAIELTRRDLDVIVALDTAAAHAAKDASGSIPVAFATSDPRALVGTLARPGRNLTGVTNIGTDIAAKQLELLHGIVPRASYAAALARSNSPATSPFTKEVETAARSLGLRLDFVFMRNGSDIERGLQAMTRQRLDIFLVQADALFFQEMNQILRFAALRRLPAMYGAAEFPRAGGLVSYGTDLPALYRQLAGHVDRILRGAKAGDLPVEQPTKFELVINLKTAKALGLTIPPSLLARADQVIE